MMENYCNENYQYIEENLKRIQDEIYNTAIKVGRNPSDITLLAATKTVSADKINFAISKGLNCIGENRVQELMDKYDNLNLENCDCHFIGALQTNKIKYICDKVSLIHSVDNIRQVNEIAKQCDKLGIKKDILIEVNVGDEASKSGVAKDELYEFIGEIQKYSQIVVKGLMCIPPICEKKRDIFKYFSQIYKYYIDISSKRLDNINMHTLSMGMSSDYKEAIECGSTLIRVGSAIFGNR